MPNVIIAVPNRGAIKEGTVKSLLTFGKTPVLDVALRSTSLLTFTFNDLWCHALNSRPEATHFVMLHDDVVPIESGWLDILLSEYEKSGADVLSCVVPINDDRGLTSTAFCNPRTGEMKRLTMHEAAALPLTFDAMAAGHPEKIVLPNTGLWICSLRGSWVEKICFTIRDRVFQDPVTKKWKAQCWGEDWDFGMQCWGHRLKVMATRAVKLIHKGGFDYPNMVGWGGWKTDPDTNYWTPPERHYHSNADPITI